MTFAFPNCTQVCLLCSTLLCFACDIHSYIYASHSVSLLLMRAMGLPNVCRNCCMTLFVALCSMQKLKKKRKKV